MNSIRAIALARPTQVSQCQSFKLGMAELCPFGLSEQWLLMTGGDAHWSLIAKAMGQRDAMFHDLYGRPVYAAFCATSLELEPLETSLLAQEITISSGLFRVGKGRIGSVHGIFFRERRIAQLRMISTFVSHDASKANSRIVRNRNMPQIDLIDAPATLIELADTARIAARSCQKTCPDSKEILTSLPCPATDFNAVGLLYFPSFSKIAEQAHWAKQGDGSVLARRDVTYLGNLDQGQGVTVFDSGSGMTIKRDDDVTIAHVASLHCQDGTHRLNLKSYPIRQS